jgi:hypothetical protein
MMFYAAFIRFIPSKYVFDIICPLQLLMADCNPAHVVLLACVWSLGGFESLLLIGPDVPGPAYSVQIGQSHPVSHSLHSYSLGSCPAV